MLGFMRKNAGSTIVWFIMGAIILVFVFFGVGNFGGGGGGEGLSVNGQKIPFTEVEKNIRILRNSVDYNSSAADAEEIDKMIRLRAVEDVVARSLVLQYALRLGFNNSSDVLAHAVLEELYTIIPDLKPTADSTPEKQAEAIKAYENWVRSQQMTTTMFEQEVRDTIVRARMTDLVTGLGLTSKAEAYANFHFWEDELTLDYVFFPTGAYSEGLTATDEQLTEFYNNHQEDFRIAAKLRIDYVKVAASDFADEAQIDEAEIKEVYEADKASFDPPKTFEEAKDEISQDLKEKKMRSLAIAKMEDLIGRAEKNQSLKDAAQGLEVVVATSDLFTQNNPPAFLGQDSGQMADLFKRSVGMQGGPIENGDSMIYYQVAEKKESEIPALEGATKGLVMDAWILDEAKNKAKLEAVNFLAQAKQDWNSAVNNLPTVAQKGQSPSFKRLSFDEVPLFTNINKDQMAKAVTSFSAPKSVAPEAVEVLGGEEAGFYAFALAAEKIADEKIIEDMMPFLIAQYNNEMAKTMLMQWLANLHDVSEVKVPAQLID